MNTNYTNSTRILRTTMTLQRKLLVLVVLLSIPLLTKGQTNELKRHYVPFDVQLKATATAKSTNQVVTETISQQGATWLRLFFKDVNLGKESTLTITSTLDGASQTLTAESIKTWKNTSAYFNGDQITITLTVAAGETNIRASIKELGVGDPDPTSKSQCGSVDNRVDSADDAIGRIVPVGCTGWIISTGKYVTAGHCVGSRAQVLEFNVPKSNPDRSIIHPGPEDQYPIDSYVSPYPSIPSQANDWAVFEAGPNSQTGLTAFQAQGKAFEVTQDDPGSDITITGYGVDSGIDNQTQQTHTGPTASYTDTFVRYVTDTEGGNSGSPIIDTATGKAVGVHAYGGCSTNGSGSNSGERATISDFWIAMGYGTPPPPPTEDCVGNVSSFPLSESFENTLGAWTQSTIDDINWTIDANGTPSSNTGPSSAAAGNYYVYVEASGNGSGYPDKSAILNSPCLDFSGVTEPSVSFKYHMYGSAINELVVEARTNNTGDWATVFSRSGDQGNSWNAAAIPLTSYAGVSSVQLRFRVTTGSGSGGWQSDIAIDEVTISDGDNTPPPPPVCDSLDFNDFSINSFANQDAAGNYSIGSGGAAISMANNTWKFIPLNYTVTPNTVIEFDFSSTSQGEIHGIAFENDNSLSSSRVFKVHGTQSYGIRNYDDYAGGTKKYTIAVGNFYTGTMDRLVFINDNDSGSGNTSTFSNVKIYEGTCGALLSAENAIADLESKTPIMGTEDEFSAIQVKIAPNPTRGAFTIQVSNYNKDIQGTIYNVLGKRVRVLSLQKGNNAVSSSAFGLNPGIYLIKFTGPDVELGTQKLIVN
ncbi:trypsin-like peptidase domain-containing protein [Aquimarina brevivitae]|uniref:Serine protease n=1 Tax=Aquimarina brevivitae TaxID=323412 RepID=A0A4Q7NTS8_9FLAO|nr:trypsin-like peptidase domain-containing protein [Aquimarina brevivitae]RZS90593.1 putative secreted protein (Por secretion system target) [Aquimarina brevivitae]